jgi:hypothetical protein
MIIDLVVPEHSLVTISPEEVFGPEVLIWIFDPLFQRRKVFPMFPMLGPEVVCVYAAEDQARDDNAGK